MSNTIQQVPAAQIVAGLNDRETFNRSELEALAANIREYGLLQPPIYRPLADGRFQIVAGERRTRAMRDILGWPLIPAIVNDTLTNDEDAVGAMGSENRCRVDIAIMSDARSYQKNMTQFGWDIAECARRFGTNTRVVKDRLALLTLCEDAQDLVNKGTLTPGYALVLAVAGLDRNFQNRALDLLKANKAPTLEWWRGAVQELVLASQQNAMFDLDAFMTGAIEQVQAAQDVQLPLPETDAAPVIGTTAGAIFGAQIRFWQDAADAWGKRGRKAERKQCLAAARSLALANQALLALDAAQMAMAQPVPAPMAPSPSEPPMAPPMAPPMDVPADVLVEAITGRAGHAVCTCGRRATHKVAYKETSADGLGRRLVVKTVCNKHLPDGVAPLVAGPAEQLTFGIAA